MLEIDNMSDFDFLFYFKDGLNELARVELDKRNV